MKELIAYCGLDCESCEARTATVRNDDALREKVAALWSELNGVEISGSCAEHMTCEKLGMILKNNGEARRNLGV